MRKGKSLNFERLENRRLLAADLGFDVMECVDAPPMEPCMVAPEIAETGEQEVCVDPIAPDEGPLPTDAIEPAVQLDLADGMDGYFGQIDQANPSNTLQFTTNENGMVDVVVASSFGEHSTNLSVSDSEGNLITASETEGLDGFQTLSFAAESGQTYELTIESEDGGEGNFQVTIGQEAETVDVIDNGPVNPVEDDTNSEVDEDSCDTVDDSAETPDTDPVDEGPANEDPGDETTDTDNDVVSEDECDVDPDSEPTDETEDTGDEETDSPVDEGPVNDSDSESDDDADTDPADDPATDPVEDSETDPVDDLIDNGPVEPSEDDCTDEGPTITDLHANEIGPDATELQFTDGAASISGELESVDDIDVFRFTAASDGEIMLFAGELSQANVDLDIQVHDADGNLIVDGATNEAVKLSFNTEKNVEYFVSVNSGTDQGGSYDILLEVAEDNGPVIVDDHANEIGDQASDVATVDGNGQMTGELETAEDTDAFRVTSNSDGQIELDLQVTSENDSTDAQVSVFNADGELIVDGTTNSSVGLRFDAAANTEYQILVDSLNDVPMNYEFVTSEIPTIVTEAAPTADADSDLPTHSHDHDHDHEHDLADEEMQVCTFDADTDESSTEDIDDDIEAGPTQDAENALDELFANPEFQWAFSFDGDRFYSRFTGV